MRRKEIFLVLSVAAVVGAGVALTTVPASAASAVTLDASTCGINGPDVTLDGTWTAATNTCMVTGFAAVQSGSSLTIPSGTTLTDASPTHQFNNGGSVTNDGIVEACLWDDFAKGATTNAAGATFEISVLGSCTSSEHEIFLGGQFQNFGRYTNSGTLVIDGSGAGASLTNHCGSSYSETGTVDTVNGGTLAFPSGCPQTITFTGPSTGIVGGFYTASASASSELPVSVALNTSSSGCTLTGSTVMFTAAGTCLVDATQAGNSTYAAATTVQVSTNISTPAQQSQTITFLPLADMPYGSAPFSVSATATSALTVLFGTSTPGVCTVSGSTVTVLTTGTCTVQATQPGDASWLAAPPVSQSFSVFAVVKLLQPEVLRVDRGIPILVVFALVDANGEPIPSTIASSANLVVSYNGGFPRTAFYVPKLQLFSALIPASQEPPPGTHLLTITSNSPSVPISPRTFPVRTRFRHRRMAKAERG